MAKPALGRGLGALLGGTPVLPKPPSPGPSAATLIHAAAAPPPPADDRERVLRVPLDRIRPSPFQPRKEFSPEALKELADSIREQGIVQPLIVRDRQGHYELIAGERRWRAAQLIGLKEVPALVRDADDLRTLELALIENLQREDLNAIEEALGYSQLADQFALTQEEIAAKVGKSRVAVTNALRLLKLPAPVQKDLRDGKLSVGHAKVLLGLPFEKQQHAAGRVLRDGLNVRQTEELVARLLAAEPNAAPKAAPPRDAQVTSLEGKLREKLGTKVHLRYRGGKGAIEIAYFSDDELERILQLLGVVVD
jgi:ParB family chromosome partitioning protein